MSCVVLCGVVWPTQWFSGTVHKVTRNRRYIGGERASARDLDISALVVAHEIDRMDGTTAVTRMV